MAYIYNLTDTWNAAGTAFNGIKMAVTNTASASSSYMINLTVSGTTTGTFTVDKNGIGYISTSMGIGVAAGAGISLDTGGIAVPQIRTLSTTNAVDTRIVANGTNSYGSIGTYSNHDILFVANGSEKARIQASTGYLGISTVPTAVIDAGRATASGQTDAMQKWTWNAGATTWGLRLDQVHTGSAIDYAFRVRNGSTSDIEALYVKASGLIGVGTASPTSRLTVSGAMALAAPTTKTSDYSLAIGDSSLIFNGAATITLTLQAASSFPGRILYVKTIAAQTVVSASSNVVPVGSSTAGTAILAATAGKWAMLQSDGTNWVVMMAN